MNLAREVEEDWKKLDRYREGIRRKANRLLDIMNFLEKEIENEHPDYLPNFRIDVSFFDEDLKVIIKQKKIEDYKSEMSTIAYTLAECCKDIGLKKKPFIRKYKVWLLLKK
jgi:hypothetical protein